MKMLKGGYLKPGCGVSTFSFDVRFLCDRFTVWYFGVSKPAAFSIVIENLRIPAPIHRSIELALHFLFREMLVENVVEKFVVDGMVRLPLENTVNLPQDCDVFQHCGSKQNLARLNVSIRKLHSFPRELHISLFQLGKAQ